MRFPRAGMESAALQFLGQAAKGTHSAFPAVLGDTKVDFWDTGCRLCQLKLKIKQSFSSASSAAVTPATKGLTAGLGVHWELLGSGNHCGGRKPHQKPGGSFHTINKHLGLKLPFPQHQQPRLFFQPGKINLLPQEHQHRRNAQDKAQPLSLSVVHKASTQAGEMISHCSILF